MPYDQPMPSDSPLAAALERVGDRWSLLIIDALLTGPRRFGELQAGVAGIAPNILTDRLRHAGRGALVVPDMRARSRRAGDGGPALPLERLEHHEPHDDHQADAAHRRQHEWASARGKLIQLLRRDRRLVSVRLLHEAGDTGRGSHPGCRCVTSVAPEMNWILRRDAPP